MKSKQITVFFLLIIFLILGTILVVASRTAGEDTSGKYDTFATCLKNSGAVFYGASWCPHCQSQKKLFGSSAKLLNYVQCSTSPNKQEQICADKKITGYPTWELADGTRPPLENSSGVSLETLSQKTGCPLPE